ncbi:MAG: hypothetical protein JRN52_08375 [Nitrososphaerota archaeon]|nr:hypothetical protein [Nitrososphaerota archaeon]
MSQGSDLIHVGLMEQRPFHRSIKEDYIWQHEFDSFQEADEMMTSFFHDYNLEQTTLITELSYAQGVRFIFGHCEE